MRVCDISKKDEATTRYVIVETELDGVVNTEAGDAATVTGRVVHDYETGEPAATAFESGNWKALHELTPRDERPKDEKRSAAASQAAATRAANKALLAATNENTAGE